MFAVTKNPYQFKYLITALTGEGIKQVYLPEVPKDKSEILFAEEKKWVRTEPTARVKKAMKEYYTLIKKNPNYQHPYQQELDDYEEEEWKRCVRGVFFWNAYEDSTKEPEIVYITGFHYWYLTHFKPYFGAPDFRDPDKEVFYWILFCEEDPDCFGGAFNTIRRWAKSTVLGAWLIYRTTTNYSHNSGMQGETDKKIAKFYRKSVLKPFMKLPPFLQPTYNTDTKQANQIEFDLPPSRAKSRSSIDLDDIQALESMIDYRASGEGEYDGDILNSYVMEEPGKTVKVSLYNNEGEGRWDIVKPCFLQGEEICGKALLGTTVENLKTNDKGGKAYKKLVYDSDYDQKQADGRTISGLYFAFLPGDCAYKGYYDKNGRPKRREAKMSLLRTRESYKGNPSKLAGWIRKYPLTVIEIFYVSPDHCVFNSEILNNRLRELDTATTNNINRGEFYWENNVRFSRSLWRHNPTGWAQASWLPNNPKETNLVDKRQVGGKMKYTPKNHRKAMCGVDPIQHRSASKRESKPVLYVKRKFDPLIEGFQWDLEELEKRAKPGRLVGQEWVLDEQNGKPWPYKTNRYAVRMGVRPKDPNVLYERVLLICWHFGIPFNVEKQFGGGMMSYMWLWGCEDFIQMKYKPEFEKPDKNIQEGTSANVGTIEDYFNDLITDVEYFGHTYDFREMIEDMLIADPDDMTEHDDTVAAGFTTMSGKILPKIPDRKPTQPASRLIPAIGPDGYYLE